jgi:hypothetical protein
MRWSALVLVAWLSGCSFAFVKGPPANHEQLPYFDCTESRVAPVLDTIFAVLEGVNLVYAASATDQQWSDNFNGNPPIARDSAIPLYVLLAVLGAGGAYYGYSNTGECRYAKQQAMVRAARPPYVPQPAGWPSPYPPAPFPPAAPPGSYAPPPYPPGTSPYAPPPAASAPSPYAPPPPGPLPAPGPTNAPVPPPPPQR